VRSQTLHIFGYNVWGGRIKWR